MLIFESKQYLCLQNINICAGMKNLFLLLCLLAGSVMPTWACTSAVVSGRATPDGRPLLWKHRDTDFLKNHVEYVKGEKYDFIAVVNSEDLAVLFIGHWKSVLPWMTFVISLIQSVSPV